MRLWVLLIVSLLAGLSAAHAQLRAIPDGAKGGAIRHLHGAIVTINGAELRLAPGAQIRDESNRIVVPAEVRAGAKVRYLLNDEGLVQRVWILTPAEAAKREAVKN